MGRTHSSTESVSVEPDPHKKTRNAGCGCLGAVGILLIVLAIFALPIPFASEILGVIGLVCIGLSILGIQFV